MCETRDSILNTIKNTYISYTLYTTGLNVVETLPHIKDITYISYVDSILFLL